jgi:hypothetical protein
VDMEFMVLFSVASVLLISFAAMDTYLQLYTETSEKQYCKLVNLESKWTFCCCMCNQPCNTFVKDQLFSQSS